MEGKRFQRKREDFVCEWCSAKVSGTGYTDHCPDCLSSKHVDNNPGDRASKCGGRMVPIGAEYKSGEFIISYRCISCGKRKRVRAAELDDREMLVRLATPQKK